MERKGRGLIYNGDYLGRLSKTTKEFLPRLGLPKYDVECVSFSYAGEGSFYSVNRQKEVTSVTNATLALKLEQ